MTEQEKQECREALKRFEAKYTPEPTSGCWLWTGSTNGKRGYGKMLFNGRLRLAHAVSYELHVCPMPEGLTLDHRCRTLFASTLTI